MRFRPSPRIGAGVRDNVTRRARDAEEGKGLRYTVSDEAPARTIGEPWEGALAAGWRRRAGDGGSEPPDLALVREVEDLVPGAGWFGGKTQKAFRRGLIAVATDDLETAVEAFGRASSNDTRNSSDDLFLGYTLSNLGRVEEAIDALEAVVTSDTSLPDDLMRKFASNLDLSIQAEIVPGIEVELPFDSAGAAMLLAELYQETGRLEDAADLVEGLGHAGLEDTIVSVSLAELYCAQRAWDDVLRVTDGFANDDDLGVAILTYRAAALAGLGRLDAALADLEAALAASDRSPMLLAAARYRRARIYEDQAQPARAREDYQAVLTLTPDFADAQQRLALTQ